MIGTAVGTTVSTIIAEELCQTIDNEACCEEGVVNYNVMLEPKTLTATETTDLDI